MRVCYDLGEKFRLKFYRNGSRIILGRRQSNTDYDYKLQYLDVLKAYFVIAAKTIHP
jgi:hypothetical protein